MIDFSVKSVTSGHTPKKALIQKRVLYNEKKLQFKPSVSIVFALAMPQAAYALRRASMPQAAYGARFFSV
jgi:hypothetical protein